MRVLSEGKTLLPHKNITSMIRVPEPEADIALAHAWTMHGFLPSSLHSWACSVEEYKIKADSTDTRQIRVRSLEPPV